jgi:osmotically-inducible protein OsmY
MQTWGAKAFLAGGMLVAAAGLASAQSMGGAAGSGGGFSGGGGSSSGGFSGSSGGFSGSSGGFTGSSGSATGGFTGTGGFSGAGGNQGGGGGAGLGGAGRTGTATGGTAVPGATTPFGRYYGDPLYNGLTSGQSATSSTNGSKYLRQPPVAVSFGTPLYNMANTATTTRTATQQTTATTAFSGANSLGFRRAPGYTTTPVFDMPARPSLASMQPQLQDIVARATRLPSRNNIRVIAQGEAIVLRGRVRDERERRLAEALIRLTPGVGLVKNELQPPER